MSMDDKKYTIDGIPASAREIIRAAKEIDSSFGSDGFLSTSQAAAILRQDGMEVGNKEVE